jgi:phenylacetate-CoA ligase
MKFINKLYKISPIFLQNLGISLYGLYWKNRRFGGKFTDYNNEFRNRECYSDEEWIWYVNSELRKILLHAYKHVPYYKKVFIKIGIAPNFFEDFTVYDLSKIPFLEKNELRKYGESELLSDKREQNGEFYSSSGSTGTPVKVLFSKNMHQKWSSAFECRIRNWANLSINDGRGMIGGRRVVAQSDDKGPFYRFNYFENQIYFSAYHISSKNVPDYVNAINKYKPSYMTGYAMSNYILARLIEQNNLTVEPLKAVITSSEKLTLEMRNTFKKVYGCRTYDSYSGVEACSLISECEYGKLHVSQDVGYIEFIKEDGSYAKPGEYGEMVCTGFLNYDQPLIRYRIGDVAKISLVQGCDCGRNMLIVEEIVGRTEDVVTGLDGRKMVRFHGIFIEIPSIIEGQIIQHTLVQFEIKLVLSKPLKNEEEKMIYKRMESQLGRIELTLNVVDFIPRTKSGKFKAVISHVNN